MWSAPIQGVHSRPSGQELLFTSGALGVEAGLAVLYGVRGPDRVVRLKAAERP